jgi:hypothetical protein
MRGRKYRLVFIFLNLSKWTTGEVYRKAPWRF